MLSTTTTPSPFKMIGGGSFPIGSGTAQSIVTFQVNEYTALPTVDADNNLIPSATYRGRNHQQDANETAQQFFDSIGEHLTIREMDALVHILAAQVAKHRKYDPAFRSAHPTVEWASSGSPGGWSNANYVGEGYNPQAIPPPPPAPPFRTKPHYM